MFPLKKVLMALFLLLYFIRVLKQMEIMLTIYHGPIDGGSYMSAHVLLNLLHMLWKSDEM